MSVEHMPPQAGKAPFRAPTGPIRMKQFDADAHVIELDLERADVAARRCARLDDNRQSHATRLGREPAGERDLLLVAAGQAPARGRGAGGADGELLDVAGGQLVLRAVAHEAARENLPSAQTLSSNHE